MFHIVGKYYQETLIMIIHYTRMLAFLKHIIYTCFKALRTGKAVIRSFRIDDVITVL